MKKSLLLILVLLMPLCIMAKKNQNILVWASVDLAEDGEYYMTLYKNCPATVLAEFHFKYKDKSISETFQMEMPDSVASMTDPVPVGNNVKDVIIDKVVYSAIDSDGQVYRTQDPNDEHLALILMDLFDIWHDIFWWDSMHRANYYSSSRYDRWLKAGRGGKTPADNLDLTKLDNDALVIGAIAVAAASAGMAIAISKQWNTPDARFPYFSISPQVQYFAETGNMRDVMQFKYRFGGKGGMSVLADMGWSSGSTNEANCFDPGFTWSVGLGLDLGAFSLSLRGKPATDRYEENFITCQAVYDIMLGRSFAIDLSAGAGAIKHDGDYYLDVPLSIGLLYRF